MSTQLDSVLAFVSERAPVEMPAAPDGSRVIVVGAGKGGVGTSTVACLLALVSAALGHDVLLVDGADGHGVQHLLLGVGDEDDASADVRPLHPGESVVEVTPNLSLARVLDAGDAARPGGHRGGDPRSRFRRVSARFAAHDLVVIDGGSRLESVLAACEGGIGLLLAVTASDRICLAATYALVKAIGARLGERPVAVLGNRLDEASAREAANLVNAATRRFLRREVDFAGALPDDACLHAGVAAGMPVQDAASGSPAAAAMHEIALKLFDSIPSAGPDSGRRRLPWR